MTIQNEEVEEALDVSLVHAAIGDILMTGVDSPVPADWHPCDGTELRSAEYPLFVQAMGIAGATFTLPEPVTVGQQQRFIIKLGEHVLPVARTLPTFVADQQKRTLVGTMMVRDEADIIAASIEHALTYLDHLLIVDNASADGTTEILAEYAATGRVSVSRDESQTKPQGERVTEMARRAFTDLQADWVINLDADEFLVPTGEASSVREVLESTALSAPSFCVPVVKLVGAPAKSGAGIERLVYRSAATQTPIAIHRGSAGVIVEQGNHRTSLPVAPIQDPRLEILHLSWRSSAQVQTKVTNTGWAYARDPGTSNPSARADYQRLLDGSLNDYYLSLMPLPSEVADLEVEDELGHALRQVTAVLPDRLTAVLDDVEDLVPEADQQAARARVAS